MYMHNTNWYECKVYTVIIATERTLCYYRTSEQSRLADGQALYLLLWADWYMYIKSEPKETHT